MTFGDRSRLTRLPAVSVAEIFTLLLIAGFAIAGIALVVGLVMLSDPLIPPEALTRCHSTFPLDSTRP